MQLWPVAHFFHFVITLGWVQQQSNSKPIQKVMTEWKKWETGQSCIRKEVTSYKIHTSSILLSNSYKNQKVAWVDKSKSTANLTKLSLKNGK